VACAGAIASSEEQGTIEVVLGNPIPRWQFVVGNFAATALSLLGGVAVRGGSCGKQPCSWASTFLSP